MLRTEIGFVCLFFFLRKIEINIYYLFLLFGLGIRRLQGYKFILHKPNAQFEMHWANGAEHHTSTGQNVA